jgi:hypothetical protein
VHFFIIFTGEKGVHGNAKRRRIKDDGKRTSTQNAALARKPKMQRTKMEESKTVQPLSRTQKRRALPTQPSGKNITPKIQAVETKRLTRLFIKKNQKSKKEFPASNSSQTVKKTQVRGQSSKMKLPKRDKDKRKTAIYVNSDRGKTSRKLEPPKQRLTSKASEREIPNTPNQRQKKRRRNGKVKKNANQKVEDHTSIQQIIKAKHTTVSKTKMIKRNSKKKAHELATDTGNLLLLGKECSPKSFPSLFAKKITPRCHSELGNLREIHGISVSHDNLVWVNHLQKCIHLQHTSGEVLRKIQLDYSPVFNCPTPSGDILVTQGCAGGSKPVITLVSRDGNSRELADLSPYATNLYGILCENEDVYVAVEGNRSPYTNSIIKLSISGEVERVYNIENYCFINKIISLNGQIIGLSTSGTIMMPLKNEIISSEKVNKVDIQSLYSASASVDNFGNVIVASYNKLVIIHPNLEIMHTIDADVGSIISTAVDKNNQLWLGTSSGQLYSAQYLK